MKRHLLESLLLALFFTLIFILVSLLFPEHLNLDLFILALIFLFTYDGLQSTVRFLISRRFYLFHSSAELALEQFNNRLNAIVDYHELVAEYYQLFETIFPEHDWAFYIFDQNSFILQRAEFTDEAKLLPNEIELDLGKDFTGPAPLQELDLADSDTFSKTQFTESGLSHLIAFPGKEEKTALLFISRKNLRPFQDREINRLAQRVIKKSGHILENTALFLDVRQRNLEIKKLLEVSQLLLSSFNTDNILDFLLKALNDVIPTDAAVIFLLDRDSGRLRKMISHGYDKVVGDINLKLGQGACGWVAESGESHVIDDVQNADHYYPFRQETKSQVSIPLKIQDDVLGVICLESDETGFFTRSLVEILTIFANQAAIALNNARQHKIQMQKISLEHELVHAGKVQQVLLPTRPPHYDALNISFTNVPSKIVGGDLFDVVAISKNKLGLVIGDISGKGAGAAIMMSLLLAGFRAFKKSHLAVCEVVAKLNNLLYESISDGRYATFFYGVVDLENSVITYSNAGHNPPFLVRTDGSVEELTGGGIVLGYLENESYVQREISFSKGDTLVLYTDGITESMNAANEEFGEERLIATISEHRNLSAYELRSKILKEINTFSNNADAADDMTLMIIKHT